MDAFLPVWAQPHRFVLLDQRQRGVFTFALVLTDLRLLRRADGVRLFGRRYGFEWLPGLSAGVQREVRSELPRSELETFLLEEHGLRGPGHLDLTGWEKWDGSAGEPSDDVLEAFAQRHGAQIARWALNAFNLLDAKLSTFARERRRVEDGHGAAVRMRLQLSQMRHEVQSVNAIDGSHHWARSYETLYERVTLEFEDLAIRRPRPRICSLCNRVYVPIRADQPTCGNQIWDASRRTLVRRCVPESEVGVFDTAESAVYERRRKARWAAMDRVLKKHGHGDARTKDAIAKWEAWRKENPPPRLPGRPRKTADSGTPPFVPAG